MYEFESNKIGTTSLNSIVADKSHRVIVALSNAKAQHLKLYVSWDIVRDRDVQQFRVRFFEHKAAKGLTFSAEVCEYYIFE